MYERENILKIFKGTKEAVLREDPAKIKNLSNQTNNSVALTNDPDNIAAAVIIYALSKILERPGYRNMSGWDKFYDTYTRTIDKIIDSIKRGDDKAYRDNVGIIREAIEKISGKLKEYIQDVFRKASINKASKLYEHGISMETTAKLLGVTIFELAEYSGQSEYNSEMPQTNTFDVRQRIKLAMDMFE